MAFMVCHMEKFSEKDIQGIGIHNERKTENSKNEDIDYSRTPENTELHEELNSSYIAKVNKIIDNGYTSDRKIRENTVKMVSFVVSASPDYINNLEKSEQERYFKESYNYLAEKVGKSNIVSAKVHYDEKTPHMHFCSVPLTKDGRLSAKELFDRNTLKEIQNNLHTHLKSKGFDLVKGEKKEKVKHLDSHKFKAQELKNEINKIEKDIFDLEERKKTLENNLKNTDYLARPIDINKFQRINKPVFGVFNEKKESIILYPEEMNKIIDSAELGRIYKKENEDLIEQNKNLEKSLKDKFDLAETNNSFFKALEINFDTMPKEQFKEHLERVIKPVLDDMPLSLVNDKALNFINSCNKYNSAFAKDKIMPILKPIVEKVRKNKELKIEKEKTRYKNLGINR